MNDLQDPADQAKAAMEDDLQKEEAKTFDMSQLSLSDFERIPTSRAKTIPIFERYPYPPKLRLGEIGRDKKKPIYAEVCPTFIVALDPRSEPDQDVSGLRLSIVNTKTKKEEIKDIGTYHSRFIRNLESNVDVVFDRDLVMDGKTVHFAIVRDHAVRAQVLFSWDDDRNRAAVDTRYMLLDMNQVSLLRRLYEQLKKPALRRELQAAGISGEIEMDENALTAVATEV